MKPLPASGGRASRLTVPSGIGRSDSATAHMKKLLLVVVLVGIGYVVYRQIAANKAEQDLWSEATSEPDLR